MPTRILVVCLGNICRSPAAEAVLRRLLPDHRIDSAGTSDWHVGEPPHPPMIRAAAMRGYDLTPLRARQIRAQDFVDFDLILAMDTKNLADIETLRPAGSATPVRLFTDYAPEAGASHVPDPYFTNDYNGVLDLIEAAAMGLAKKLPR